MNSEYINDYFVDFDGNISAMNLDVETIFIEGDYFYYEIEDKFSYRPDLMAREYIGNENLYFLILWLNDIRNPQYMRPGVTIKIPTPEFLTKLIDIINKEKLGVG